MKKIMFVDEHKIVNYAGGAEKAICNFANEFIGRGYMVDIVCMDVDKGKPLYPLEKKVRFINLFYNEAGKPVFGGWDWLFKKIQKEFLRTLFGAKMKFMGISIKDPKKEYYFQQFVHCLHNTIVQEKPDIIISISVDGAGIIQKAILNEKIPIIAMCHTDPTHFFSELTEEQWGYWRKCDYVQVLLPVFLSKLREKGLNNTVVISNVVPQIDDDKICDLEKEHKRIIMVGRVEGGTKRQHLVIEAFARLAKSYPDWTVNIYGELANKRYVNKLHQLIKKNHLENQVFLNGVTNQVDKCLLESDIFAFPSEYEGFSLALTEGMSIGLPVIGCEDCLSVSNMVEDGKTGFLVKPDADSLAEKMKLLMDDKALRINIGKQAHEAMKRYEAKSIYDMWEGLIDECLGEK